MPVLRKRTMPAISFNVLERNLKPKRVDEMFCTSATEWRHNSTGHTCKTFTNGNAGKPKSCLLSICKSLLRTAWIFYPIPIPIHSEISIPNSDSCTLAAEVFYCNSYSPIFVKIIPIPIPIPIPQPFLY